MNKIELKKPSKVVILSAIVVIVTIIIAGVFIYMPFLSKNKSLRSQILAERNRNVLIGKIRALGKHLKVYEKRIPKQKGVSWLLREVSDMATKEGIEISSIKPGIPEDQGLHTKLYVTMDTISTFHHLGKFISRVESSENFLRVENISIKRLDLDGGFSEDKAKFKSFDVKAHIAVSTIILKE